MSQYLPDVDAYREDGVAICVELHVIPDDRFKAREKFSFSARVNPTYDIYVDGKKKPQPIMDKDKIKQRFAKWIDKAAVCIIGGDSDNGVKLEGAQISYNREFRRKITHHSVYVTGVLEVKDGARFVELLTKGVGDGRRHGFGMIVPYSCLRD
jgi:CRISPR-associated protein Cas6/Cse3/CasE subtype I-E